MIYPLQCKSFVSAEFPKIHIKKEDVEVAFSKLVSLICWGLYSNVAFLGANSDTLLLLNRQDLKNSNYKIENLVMEESGASTESFVDKAIKLIDADNDILVTNLIQIITRKHVIDHEIIPRQLDRISNKILRGIPKKELLISSRINKKEN